MAKRVRCDSRVEGRKAFSTAPDGFAHFAKDTGLCVPLDSCSQGPTSPPCSPPPPCLIASWPFALIQRFNVNLYADGKVCLSLLGKDSGASASGDKWNPETSSLWQVRIVLMPAKPAHPGWPLLLIDTKANYVAGTITDRLKRKQQPIIFVTTYSRL